MFSKYMIRGFVGLCGTICLAFLCVKNIKEITVRIKNIHEQKKYIVLLYCGEILLCATCLWASLAYLDIEYAGKYTEYLPAIMIMLFAFGALFVAKAQQIYIKDMQKRHDKNLIPEIKKQKKNCIKLYLGAIIFGAIAIFIFIH